MLRLSIGAKGELAGYTNFGHESQATSTRAWPAVRARGLTTISTSLPSRTRNRTSRSSENPASRPRTSADTSADRSQPLQRLGRHVLLSALGKGLVYKFSDTSPRFESPGRYAPPRPEAVRFGASAVGRWAEASQVPATQSVSCRADRRAQHGERGCSSRRWPPRRGGARSRTTQRDRSARPRIGTSSAAAKRTTRQRGRW